uniref:Uncharacterized protein n=1 Tax=Lepeophtheirus salmonis TaxID=72036 RepID=A0A0K2TZQ1_LEPSM
MGFLGVNEIFRLLYVSFDISFIL